MNQYISFGAFRCCAIVACEGGGSKIVIVQGLVDASVYWIDQITFVCVSSRLFGSLSDRMRAMNAKAVNSVNEASRPYASAT